MNTDLLKIADKEFSSRLLVGTGKFSSPLVMKEAIAASGTEVVTMALRRVSVSDPQDSILAHIDPKKIFDFAQHIGGV